jgi:nucleoid-associated protein YgaU
MVVPFVVIGAVALVTVVFADRYVRPQLSDDRAIVANAPTAPAASQPGTGEQDTGQDQAPNKLAAVQAETDHLAATLNPPKAPDKTSDKSPDKASDKAADQDAATPEFDVASIQPTGEAVVAGRAAPGATVELLRNGELHDRTVADKDGQFVMIPRPLPPGNYDLTLRARQPDGKEATSKQRVAVAVEAPASQQSTIASSRPSESGVQTPPPAAPAVASPKVAEAAKAEHNAEAAQTRPTGSKDTSPIRRSQLAAAEAAVLPRATSQSTGSTPRLTTATVARGDSLWRISQRALGAGTRYSVLYNANRDRIRNADLIYPGQVFVLPAR